MNIRMIGPPVANTINVHGRSYSGTPGGVYDVQDGDAQVLGTAGWIIVAPSGPTSSRPPTGQLGGYSALPGVSFFDESIGKLVFFDGQTWRDPATGAAV